MPLTKMKNRNGRLFTFTESMGEALVEEENRPGLFRLEGPGNLDRWEKVDSQLTEFRQSGLSYLKSITDAHETDVPHNSRLSTY